MKHRIFLCLLVALFLGALASANDCHAAEMQTFNIRVHSQMPTTHYVVKAVDLFAAEANKLSNGTLKFTHYPAQQLYRDKEMPDVLPKGGVEVAQVNGSMFIGKVPEVSIASLPATFDNLDHFYRYYYDYENSKAILVVSEAYEQKANIISLGTLLYSPNNCVLTTEPVTKIEDFQGKKIRGWGKTLTVILQAWGASGVVMSSSDVYMAMERGTIDGVFSGITSFYARKWYEPAKYVNVIDGFLPSPFTLAANLDFWKKLHPDQQRAMIKAANKAEIMCVKAAVAGWDKAQQALEAKGVKIFTWPKEQAELLKQKARPAIYEMLVEKPLGKEMVSDVQRWVEATRDSSMTWEEACNKNMERLLNEVK